MVLILGLLCVSSLASAAVLHRFQRPLAQDVVTEDFRIPTVRESTIQARRILRFESLGTLSTVFPGDASDVFPSENRPKSVGGAPIGLMEYYADCEDSGNPTFLEVTIANNFRNAAAGSNATLSIRWHRPDTSEYSAAALPRLALIGRVERMTDKQIEDGNIKKCFLQYHPDASIWQPGTDIHESHWSRLVVEEVYWFGGFGDRARIQWLPMDVFRNISAEEIDSCRLPGEKQAAGALSSCGSF